MARIVVLVFSLALLPAFGFDLEKLIDRHIEKQSESWKRETIETLASDRDPRARLEAAEWLAGRKEPEAIAALAGALSDTDARVRIAAASGLWRIEKDAEPARAQLVAALADADPSVVARVAGALQALGMKEAELAAPRKRVFAAADATVDSRFLVSRNLVGHEPPARLLEAMLAYLAKNTGPQLGSGNDPNRHNVQLAERALERLVKGARDRELIAPLVAALDNAKAGQVVLLKTLALFEPPPDGWAQVLVQRLTAPEARVRYAALGHLRKVKNDKDVAHWVPRAAALLADPDDSVRSEALWALGGAAGLAAGEIDQVVAALGDPVAGVRRRAAEAIGAIGERNQPVPAAAKARVAAVARPALEAMERDGDADVRAAAKGALARLGDGKALAAAAPAAAAGNEAGGMAVLRARKVSFEESSFFRALTEVDVELVRAFLDAGMSPQAPLADMGPPIRVMLFAGRGCAPTQRPTRPETLATVKLLLERGADANGADRNGNTALMEAAGKGCDRELMRTLIKAGAKINATNASGFTPFEAGLWMGHDGLEELIAAGYRLPPDKAKLYMEGYKDRPEAQAMIRKAARK